MAIDSQGVSHETRFDEDDDNEGSHGTSFQRASGFNFLCSDEPDPSKASNSNARTFRNTAEGTSQRHSVEQRGSGRGPVYGNGGQSFPVRGGQSERPRSFDIEVGPG